MKIYKRGVIEREELAKEIMYQFNEFSEEFINLTDTELVKYQARNDLFAEALNMGIIKDIYNFRIEVLICRDIIKEISNKLTDDVIYIDNVNNPPVYTGDENDPSIQKVPDINDILNHFFNNFVDVDFMKKLCPEEYDGSLRPGIVEKIIFGYDYLYWYYSRGVRSDENKEEIDYAPTILPKFQWTNLLRFTKEYAWEWNNKWKLWCNFKAMISNSTTEVTWEEKVCSRYEEFYQIC
jgi:hypothetical protein